MYASYIYNNKSVWSHRLDRIRSRISPVFLIITISMIGFVSGAFTIALKQENRLITEGILNRDFIYKIEELTIDKRALFFLCLEKRLRAFLLLFLLAFSSVNIFTNVLFFFLHGLYIGSVMELLVIRYGVQGFGMYASFVLPHGIFYFIGYLSLGCWCLKMEKGACDERSDKKEKIQQFRNKGQLLLSFVSVLIGIMLESYVNSYFLKIFF